jgi:hypothetical protein
VEQSNPAQIDDDGQQLVYVAKPPVVRRTGASAS